MGHQDDRTLTLAGAIAGLLTTDQAGNLTARVTVAETDKSPTNILLSNDEVQDLSGPGTIVGILSAVDENITDTHTFEITDDPDDKFTLDTDGTTRLVLDGSVNFATKETHLVTIEVTDSAGLMFSKEFTITVIQPFVNDFSLQFDGVDEYVTFGVVAAFERSDPFSVVFWYKPTTSARHFIFSNAENTVDFKGWQLLKETDDTIQILLANDVSPANFILVTTDTSLTLNVYTQIAMTWNGSSAASGVNIFFNGVAQATTTLGDTLSATMVSTESLDMGRRSDGTGFLTGFLDEVAIYNKFLSSTEVTDIYNAGVPTDLLDLTSAGNLYLWARFTQNDKDLFPTIFDASGNARDGTATNMESTDIQGDIP